MSEMKYTPGPWQNIGNCRIHGTPPYGTHDGQHEEGGEWEGVPANSLNEVCVAFPASVYGYYKDGKDHPVRRDVQERWWERNKANINLICAAPDLYEALKAIPEPNDYDGWEAWGEGMVNWERNYLRPAIAKAEGK